MNGTPRQPPHPILELQPRYVFLAGLAEERRILDIGGDATGLLTLAEAGASELTAATDDVDATRRTIEEAEVEGVEVQPIPSLPLPWDANSFDLIICHDLGERIVAEPRWQQELRRVLSDDGYLVMALANPSGQTLSDLQGRAFMPALTYQEAFERLNEAFGTLTLLGQAPVIANLFYDFESEEEDPDLVLDRSLLGEEDEEPGWYVLLFGPQAVHRDDLTFVQAPFGRVTTLVRQEGQPPQEVSADAVAAADVEHAREAADRFRQERDILAGQVADLQHEIDSARERLTQAAAGAELVEASQLVLARQEAELRQAWTRSAAAENAAAALRFEADRAASAAEEANAQAGEIEALRTSKQEVEAELDTLRREHTETTHEVAALKEKLDEIEAHRSQLLEHQEATHGELKTARSNVDELDNARRELELKLDELSAGIDEKDRAVDEARSELERARQEAEESTRAAGSDAETKVQQATAEAEERLSQTRAELEARISELEQQLTEARQEAEEADTAAKLRIEELQSDLDRTRAAGEEAGKERIEALELELDVARDAAEKAREAHEAALTEVQGQLNEASETLARRTDEVGGQQERISELEEEMTRQGKDRQSFEDQIKDLLEEVGQLREADEMRRDELETLRSSVGEAEATATALEAAAETATSAQTRAELAEQEAAGIRSELEQLRQAQSEAPSTEEVERLQQELEELRQAAADAPSTEEVEGLRQELEQLRQAAADAPSTEEVERLQQEATTTREELEQLRAAAADAPDSEPDPELEQKLTQAAKEAEEQASAARQAKVRIEELLEELARQKQKLEAVQSERDALAAEAQRLTDAMHGGDDDAAPAAPAAAPPADDADPTEMPAGFEDTVVMEMPPLAAEESAAAPAEAPSTAEESAGADESSEDAPVQRDAVGRPLENTLEDIEDLIASSVPPSPTRR